MASATPIVKQISWSSFVPQLAVGALLVFAAFFFFDAGNPVLIGLVSYLAIFFALRNFVASHHRKGIRLVKSQKFGAAIEEFEKSYRFFSRNFWLDRYRYVALLSSSAVSYREMALVNIAFCYSQIGNGRESKAYYERALAEFPDSEIAKSSLRMIASAAEHVRQERA